MSSIFVILASGLFAILSGQPIASAGPMPMLGPAVVHILSLQDPEDPNRVLGLLNGLIARVQESSPVLAAVLKFLAFLVYLVLNIRTWGPPALVAMVVVVGFLIWQGRRRKKQGPPVDEELETEPEL